MKNILLSGRSVYRKYIRKPSVEEQLQQNLVEELRTTREALDKAYMRFEAESDDVMMDCIIFEIQSLRARYRFLLKQAKEEGVVCDKISIFG